MRAEGDREATVVFECRVVLFNLVDLEGELLGAARVVRERLVRENARLGRDDLAVTEVELDAIDLVVLIDEAEVLVVVDTARRMVPQVRVSCRARVDGIALGGSDETERL